jgi:hypothetical protein
MELMLALSSAPASGTAKALPTVDLGPPTAAPSVAGSGTSRRAASGMSANVRGALERIVFQVIQEAGHAGATDDEIEVVTGLSHQCASARRNGLVQKRKVRNSGQCRATRSGALANVWVTGEGIPVAGAPNRRALARPDSKELRLAAQHLLGNSEAIERVRAWLAALAEQ